VRDRVRAADDLARLGKAARPALPKLRRALSDAEPAVALAAAEAVARLDADDTEAVDAIRTRLRHDDAKQRAAAAGALADLGPRARAALPALLAALSDKDGDARANAADAVGRIAPGSPASADAVGALTALLKDGQPEHVRRAAVRALLRLGPHARAAISALREGLSVTSDEHWTRANLEAVALLARFNPPPVELLAEAAADRRSTYEARRTALEQLAALGPRARAALPTLLRMLKEPRQPDDRGADSRRIEVAWALLDIDPEGAPAVVAPVLLERVKALSGKDHRFEHETDLFNSISALGRCGAAARPSLPALLAAIDPEDTFRAPYAVSTLTRLLTPKDRELLPELRRRFGDDHGLELGKALLRLGYRDEALAEVTKWLESDNAYCRRQAIRWLRQHPAEGRVLAPALRQAQAKAGGAERVGLALTLWRLRGSGEDGPRALALAGLDELLAACEGESHLTGYLSESPFWSERGPRGPDEREALGAAVDEVYCRVQAGSDPVAVLTRLLRDPDPYLRVAAVAALARAEPKHPDLVPALRRLLERHPDFLCHTADTLAALGPAAAPLAPLLPPNLRHPDENVYRATDRVLRRIDPALPARGWGAADVSGAVPADLGPLWEDLADKDARRADVAAWRLAGAGPRAVALLRERLRPPPTLTPERVARLIAELDDDNFATRERAGAELAAGLESAALHLRRALAAAPSPELRRRLDGLLAGLDPASAAEQRRRLRGVRLLEAMGDPDARALLRSLSRGDPRFRLTREAAAALRRLDPQPAGPNSGPCRLPRRADPPPARRLATG
jgi:HEAT repeat protein